MSGAIGYYVHHHGRGHRERAMAIAAHAPERFTLIGTGLADLPGPFSALDLPDDRPASDASFSGLDGADNRPAALHYAPLSHEGVRDRASLMAAWIAREKPALMVIDVSVEAAMLARLCATPTVYVRLAGSRIDAAHLNAFCGAKALLAPFHAELDAGPMPEWVRAKTRYFSGLTAPSPAASPDPDIVLVVMGRGGSHISRERLFDAAHATPETRWRVIGATWTTGQSPFNLDALGWVDDPEREIARAGVVVAAAGDGVMNAVAAAGRPYVCLPEPRPYDEQIAKASRLRALGAAIVLDDWPVSGRWRSILEEAKGLNVANLTRLHDVDGSTKAAAFLFEMSTR